MADLSTRSLQYGQVVMLMVVVQGDSLAGQVPISSLHQVVFSGPVWPGGHTQPQGNFDFPNNLNLQASAVPGQHPSSFPNFVSSFQTRCTTPDPAVHQMLEVWAGNIQRELVKQTETILSNKMKDMITQLGGQSGPIPFC